MADSIPSNPPIPFASTSAAARDNVRILGQSKNYEDPHWLYSDNIQASNWNKAFPYQLIVVETVDARTGTYRPVGRTGDFSAPGPVPVSDGTLSFTLPIPPQSMTISTPFAISGSVTLGGYIEEHNAAPIRMISLSGTTGVIPLRGNPGAPSLPISGGGFLGSVFAGTIRGVNTAVSNLKNTTGLGSDKKNRLDEGQYGPTDPGGTGTGYYQFRLLQRFLEMYVTAKKTAAARSWRLAFATWKDESVYLVTPVEFSVPRSAASPYEYNYTLTLRAFRRVKLNNTSSSSFEAFVPVASNPSKFRQVLNKMLDAHRTLLSFKDIIGAVRGDAQESLLEPAREVIYFAKDALSVPQTLADLPHAILSDMSGVVHDFVGLRTDLNSANHAFDKTKKQIQDDLKDIKDTLSRNPNSGSSKIVYGTKILGLTSTSSAQAPGSLSPADASNSIFTDPDAHTGLLDSIKVSDLNLPVALQAKVQKETDRVHKLTRLDHEKRRNKVFDFAAEFAESIGAGSPTYNAQFGLKPSNTTRTPTADEFDALFAMNDMIDGMNSMAASGTITNDQVSTFDYMAGLAQGSGIAFTVPTAKFAVPFPYGSTLEMLAARYLGDPNRWMEISTLNGLRTPYVDEEGFSRPLLTNGASNQVIIADSSNLYLGQSVWIESNNATRTRRHISEIKNVGTGFALTVDGDPDLDQFSVMAQARIHAFLPETVNSTQSIFIPSSGSPDRQDQKLKDIPGVDDFDPLIEISGVDLLLTQSGDLAMTPDGDLRLAYGMNNIIQKIRTALATPKGSLLHFPAYGFVSLLGVSVADIDANSIRSSIQNLLSGDPAFVGIQSVAITVSGPAVRISFAVQIRGVDKLIPVTVDVKR